MTFHGDAIGQLTYFLGQPFQKVFSERSGNAVAGFEERGLFTFDQLDPQSLGGHRKDNVFADFLERGGILHGLRQLFFELVHVVFVDGETLTA